MTTVLLGKEELDQMLVGNKAVKTGEERRSFLAFATLSEDATRLARGPCAKSRWKVATAGLSVIVFVLAVTLLALQVYHSHQAYNLRLQLDLLKKDVDNLKHRLLEEDLISELKAFKDAVYAEEAAEDSDNEDEYDYVEQEDPVNIAADTHSRKHNSKYEQLQHDDNKIFEKHDHKHNSHEKKKKMDLQQSNEKRSKREVYSYDGGVPIISESYGISNKTEGLRLYESLVANPQEITYETTENPIKDHHRISSSWSSKQHRKKYHGHRGHGSKDDGFSGRQQLEAPAPIISRPSRVMQTDTDPSRRVTNNLPSGVSQQPPKKNEGKILVRVYQEHRAPPQSTVRAMDVLEGEGPRRRRRKPTRKSSPIETLEERPPMPARHRLLPAAHYNGDTSHYPVQHEHYDGNGRLRHPDGVFADWTASKWVHQLGMERHFRLNGGVVTVKDTGLYFVYAQVHYLDEHDINGYRVYVNEEPMLQCTTMTHSVGREHVKKSNTCFTGAALLLRENDQLSLRDIGGMRYSVFETGKSFFGLIKLGNVNIQ